MGIVVYRAQTCFHGVDLSSLSQVAIEEYFRQPIVVWTK